MQCAPRVRVRIKTTTLSSCRATHLPLGRQIAVASVVALVEIWSLSQSRALPNFWVPGEDFVVLYKMHGMRFIFLIFFSVFMIIQNICKKGSTCVVLLHF